MYSLQENCLQETHVKSSNVMELEYYFYMSVSEIRNYFETFCLIEDDLNIFVLEINALQATYLFSIFNSEIYKNLWFRFKKILFYKKNYDTKLNILELITLYFKLKIRNFKNQP